PCWSRRTATRCAPWSSTWTTSTTRASPGSTSPPVSRWCTSSTTTSLRGRRAASTWTPRRPKRPSKRSRTRASSPEQWTRRRPEPPWTRPPCACWNCSQRQSRSRFGLELVAQAPDRDDVLRFAGIGFDLGAQPLDVDVEGFGVPHVVGPPDPVDQLRTGQHPAGVAEQDFQQLELFERKLHVFPAHRHHVALHVHADRPGFQD